MKASSLFVLTHGACALLAGCLAAAAVISQPGLWSVLPLLGAGLSAVLVASWILASRLRRGLRAVEQAAVASEGALECASGIREVDAMVQHVGETAQHWAEITTNHQEQSRQFQLLLTQLDRRARSHAGSSTANSVQHLRQLLSSLSNALDAELLPFRTGSEEIARDTREIATGAEDQGEAVAKSTTYVEQLSTNIENVTQHAASAHSAVLAVHASAKETLDVARALHHGVDQIRSRAESGERRLRALGDRSTEIRGLIETIATLSARTDLLALNAAIESIRAGEHGRGFAVVAEEVRKLAEQTAQAAREVAGLLDSTRLETEETVGMMAQQRAATAHEMQRSQVVGQSLERILIASDDSARRVGEINQATRLQLQLTRDLVVAVERISNAAKAGRSRAEKACWTAKTLTDAARQFETTLTPLRRCGQSPTPLATPPREAAAERFGRERRDTPRPLPSRSTDESIPELWTEAAGETVQAV